MLGVCDLDSLVILYGSSKNRSILGTLFEVDRGAKTMLWHLRETRLTPLRGVQGE